ncbi:MAG: preprotein translocase subunit SecG [Clostridium sp.]
MHNFLMVLEVISSIVIIVSVMMQPSKSDGLSGLVGGGGGASESHFAKNKTKTFESVMAKVTAVSAVCFGITTVMLNLVK